MHRSLPQSGQLFRMLLFFDAIAGAVGYGAWRCVERSEAAVLRTPSSRLMVELAIGAGTVLLAALLVRWGVYRSSSWEPSFVVALGAVVTTPFLGAPLLRGVAVAEVGERTPAPAGMQLRHRTTAARIGDTKRLSDL
jgi:hypothetical protein